MDFDDVLTLIGGYGWSQKKIIYVLGSSHAFISFNILILSFIGTEEPEWSCSGASKADQATGTDVMNRHRIADANACLAYERGECIPVYSDGESSSIVAEWDLVCSKSSWTNLSQSVFFIGWLIGSWIWGTLADKIGRKKVLFLNIAFVILSGLGYGLAPNYFVFVFFRFTSALSNAGIAISSNVLAVEVVGMSSRSFVGFFCAGFFSVSYSLLALFAYFIRNWRYLCIITSLLGLCYCALWGIVPESPRWLLVRGREQEAIDVLTKMSRDNQSRLPENCQLKKPSFGLVADHKTVSIVHLFRGRNIRHRTIILVMVWFVICMLYYALAMSGGSLGGNKYVSFSLSGLVEIPAFAVGYFIIDRIGRRWTLGGFLLAGGVSCLVWTLFLWIGTSSLCRLSIALIGKFSLAGAFATVYLNTIELIPTQVRNLGVGVTSVGGRLGGILAPMILLLSSSSESLPMVIMGGLATGAGLLSLTLPETLNQPMPETLNDLE